MPEVATPNQAEREFETGSDEFAKAQSELNAAASAVQDRLAYINAKRTYDLYQDFDAQTARQQLIELTKLNTISTQALENAVETANMVGKSYVEHNNLAHDSYWNPVSAGAGMNLTAGAVPANRTIDESTAGVAAAVAKQLDATITPVLATLQQIIQAFATATTAIGNVVNQAQPKTGA